MQGAIAEFLATYTFPALCCIVLWQAYTMQIRRALDRMAKLEAECAKLRQELDTWYHETIVKLIEAKRDMPCMAGMDTDALVGDKVTPEMREKYKHAKRSARGSSAERRVS